MSPSRRLPPADTGNVQKITDRDAGPIRDYLLFERWTLIDPDEMRRRRASWPTWRRMLRPVGATLWWLGIVLGWVLPAFNEFHPWSPTFVLGLVMLSIIAICVLLGIGLEWRDRHRDGRRVIE